MSHVPLPEALSDPADKRNPFPWFERMRASNPIRYDASREAWDVFTYEHVSEVASDHERYSSDVMGAQAGVLAESMTFSDPPRHDFLREAAAPFFTPDTLADYESTIREATVERLDAAADAGRLDVMNDLGFPVAATTVGALLGVRPDDRERFREYAWRVMRARTADGTPVDDPLKWRRELGEYFSDLIASRRRNPRNDLVSQFVEAEVDGRGLTDEDVTANCQMMMVGSTSTATMLTNAVYSFGREGLVERLAGDREALGAAIEESLRYRSSTLTVPRVAKTDAVLGERQIEEGDRLVAWVASANRDGAVFDRPDSFVLDREATHLTFGEGIHYCIGTRVARMVASVVLSELLDRVDDLEVHDAGLEPRVNPVEFGFGSLPIRFEPNSA